MVSLLKYDKIMVAGSKTSCLILVGHAFKIKCVSLLTGVYILEISKVILGWASTSESSIFWCIYSAETGLVP